MNLKSIDTREKFEAAKALGILTEKDIASVEARLAKVVNKPDLQEIPRTVTKTGELTFRYGERQGQTMDLGIVTEVKEKGGKKWLSSVVNTGFGHGKYLYSNPEDLKSLALAIADHLDALAAAGYKFKN